MTFQDIFVEIANAIGHNTSIQAIASDAGSLRLSVGPYNGDALVYLIPVETTFVDAINEAVAGGQDFGTAFTSVIATLTPATEAELEAASAPQVTDTPAETTPAA